MKTRCLIVDDEPLARELLQSYVEKMPDLELVATCSNAAEALNTIQKRQVDLVLLDIQMPKTTGFELIKTLPYQPHIIITTAYREYALDSFEFDVVDFLLKPISFERFQKAVSKVYHRKSLHLDNNSTALPVDTFEQAYMYFRVDREMVKVYLKDIFWVESMKDYVKIKTNQQQLVTYQRISFLEEKLPEDRFLRIHRSFIVSRDKIQSFNSNFVSINNKQIPIGRNYKNQVLRSLQNQLGEE